MDIKEVIKALSAKDMESYEKSKEVKNDLLALRDCLLERRKYQEARNYLYDYAIGNFTLADAMKRLDERIHRYILIGETIRDKESRFAIHNELKLDSLKRIRETVSSIADGI